MVGRVVVGDFPEDKLRSQLFFTKETQSTLRKCVHGPENENKWGQLFDIIMLTQIIFIKTVKMTSYS